ncbi:hypothetical protein GA0115260_113781, partial [Streptomyces sp. MnatMP-M27]
MGMAGPEAVRKAQHEAVREAGPEAVREAGPEAMGMAGAEAVREAGPEAMGNSPGGGRREIRAWTPGSGAEPRTRRSRISMPLEEPDRKSTAGNAPEPASPGPCAAVSCVPRSG